MLAAVQADAPHATAPTRPTPGQSFPEPWAVELVGVTRRFGSVTALAGIHLAVRRGEFFSLLGPSGCGKTTVLRLIAGLDFPDQGQVRLGGRDCLGIPAHRRPVNTVFQSYALFPHLSVWDNVAFGLRQKHVPAPELRRRVDQTLEMAGITELARRMPAQLSGGQKQRVALARAVVNEPEVLLLDEPLGALDLQLRKQLQRELQALQRRLGITFIYVTHDQEEALAMSDRVAVMRAGALAQVGPVADVYERPRSRFVAEFLGACNIIEGALERWEPAGWWVRARCGSVVVSSTPAGRSLAPGQPVILAVRPEKVRLHRGPQGGENEYPAQVRHVVYAGAETHYTLRLGAQELKTWVLNRGGEDRGFQVGQEVRVHLPPGAFVLLEA